jgi:uncharacterized protein
MISFPKILVLILLIAAVWIGLKYMSRLANAGNDPDEPAARRPAARGKGSAVATTNLVKCPACGVYVSESSPKACGKAGCPYGAPAP